LTEVCMIRLFISILILLMSISCFAAEDSLLTANSDSVTVSEPDSASQQAQSTESSEFDLGYPLSPERKELLTSYSRFKNIWRFFSFFIEIIILLALLFTGLSGKFESWAERLSNKKILVTLSYLLFYTVFIFLVNIPFDYYRGFIIEHQYGFSNLNTIEWLSESLKSQAILFVFMFIIVAVMYKLINSLKRWWLWFSLGAIPFLIFVMLIYPTVLAPMFNTFNPIGQTELGQELTGLAEKAGIENPEVYEVDASKQSNKINAYFAGVFGSKRIVLYDNTIRLFTVDELKYVMGHEIGHYVMNHMWIGIFLAIAIIMAGLYLMNRILPGIIKRYSDRFKFDRLGKVSSLPLIILFVSVFSFITQPISNGVSRIMEYDADEFGMELSGVDAQTAQITFEKLSAYNLSDPDPAGIIEFWFYDHPALNKRIARIHELYDKSMKNN